MKFMLIASHTFGIAIGNLGHSPSASAADIKPVSAALAPMPKPTLPLGTLVKWRPSRGSDYFETIVASDETTITLQSSLGCIYTISSHAEFMGRTQPLKWTNCYRSRNSGTGSIKVIDVEIWPLEVGKKWRYEYKGSNDSGRSWGSEMDCEVTKQVRVSVPADSFDTYHIFCESQWSKRDMYISPLIKRNILYMWEHKIKLRDFHRELLSYEPGKTN